MYFSCRYMATDGSYGDHIVLKGFCLWHGLRATIVQADTLVEQRFRHNQVLQHVDLALVFNGINHYSSAGKQKQRKVHQISSLHNCTLFLHDCILLLHDCILSLHDCSVSQSRYQSFGLYGSQEVQKL